MVAKTYSVTELVKKNGDGYLVPTEELLNMLATSYLAYAQSFLQARTGPSPTRSNQPATIEDSTHGARLILSGAKIHLPEILELALAERGIRRS